MRYNELLETTDSSNMLDQIKAILPKGGEAEFQAHTNTVGNIVVYWEITFRRNTYQGAYATYRSEIASANSKLEQIAGKYPGQVISFEPLTMAVVKQKDEYQIDTYSEYEQSFGGFLTLKSNEKRAKPRDGRKEYLDIVDRLMKYNGKNAGNNVVFKVTANQESVEVSWELTFTGMKFRQAITNYAEQIAKANEIMKLFLIKYNDQALALHLYSEREYRELDKYMLPQEVKDKHSITSTMNFLQVLPTAENGFGNYMVANNKRKAEFAAQSTNQ